MSTSQEDDRSSAMQIEKLTEKNYRSWATQVRAILRERKIFDVVDRTARAPVQPVRTAETDTEFDTVTHTYEAAKSAWEGKAMRACTILLSTISGNLITYVEEEDDPARIWMILKDKFRPTTDITLAQSLKYLFGMRMPEDGDMERHIRDFTSVKRRVEEHSVQLTDIVYKTIFLLSMPIRY